MLHLHQTELDVILNIKSRLNIPTHICHCQYRINNNEILNNKI